MSSEKVTPISAALTDKPADESRPWLPSWPYDFRPKGTWYLYERKDEEQELQLANFSALIVEEVVLDDGQEQRLRYAVTGQHDGIELPRIALSCEEFERMAWPAKFWGGRCIVWPGNAIRDRLRHAIQHESHRRAKVPRRTVYQHTGWREINGQWAYLSAGTVIGAGGAIEGIQTDLGPELSAYTLPAPSADDGERRAAAQASFDSAHVVGDRVAIPLIAMVYLAPLADGLGTDFALWLEGPSRSQKSTLAALMLAHFGAEIDRTKLTANFTDTANAIEAKLFALKDALTVIDDYAPQPSKQGQHDLDRTVTRIVRNVGNRAGRGRLHADCSLRREKAPRGLCLMTAEQWPTGESIVARLFGVTVSPGEANLKKLTTSQAAGVSGLLSRAMADYIQSLAADLAGAISQARDLWKRYRDMGLREALSGRSPEQLAYLMVGYRFALNCWHRAGVLSDSEVERRRKVAWQVLTQLAGDHERRISTAMPAEIFRDTLADLLSAGVVHLLPVDGELPGDDKTRQRFQRYGWKGNEPSGRHIGWVKDENHGTPDEKREAYLLLAPTLQAINDALRNAESGINLRQDALIRQLRQKGFVAEGNTEERNGRTVERAAKAVKIQGSMKRVLVFFGNKLFGSMEG